MKFPLFQHVVLSRDLPEESLEKGDLAVVVEHHPVDRGEDGYSLEIVNALGETSKVVVVPESFHEAVSADQILHVRSLRPTGTS